MALGEVAARNQPVDHLHATGRADPARGAFAAGFLGAELQGKARHAGHVQCIVGHHHATMAEHRAHGGEGLVVQRRIEVAGRYPGAERAADLGGLERPAAGGAAAVAFHQFAQGQAESALHQATVADVAGQLERHGA